MSALKGKNILLGVCGSIAAYKTAILTRLFIKEGCNLKVIMTESSESFISKLTLSTLSKNEVYQNISGTDGWNNHVELGLWADAYIIAPITANSLGKLATGLADNMLTAAYLSARCPVYLAPAMDLDMWHHTSTKRNLEAVLEAGDTLIPVGYGELASGLIGEGRMAEPEEIVEFIKTSMKKDLALEGKKILITAGPTREAIDPVRYIGNRSTGKMGRALTEVILEQGGHVELILGPVSIDLPIHPSLKITHVESAQEMYDAAVNKFQICDAAIMAAAVADYKPKFVASQKIKKSKKALSIELERTSDIAASLCKKKGSKKVVGFALESENELSNAKAKLDKKGFDFIVLNSINDVGAGFGTDTNKVDILFQGGEHKSFGLKSKKEVAYDIVNALTKELSK